MNTSARRSKSARKAKSVSKAALGRYLAAGLGATGLASVECEAAIVTLNIAALGSNSVNGTGINAGVTFGDIYNGQGLKNVTSFPSSDFNISGPYANNFRFLNGTFYGQTQIGLTPFASNIRFASGGSPATPTKFGNVASIGPLANWSQGNETLFRQGATAAPDWGANSFLGFRLNPTTVSPPPVNVYYGYFEVTWNNTLNQFQVLSGAYESTPNTPIITPVPEPSAVALTGIGALALGAGAIRRSRKARKAAAKGTLADAV